MDSMQIYIIVNLMEKKQYNSNNEIIEKSINIWYNLPIDEKSKISESL